MEPHFTHQRLRGGHEALTDHLRHGNRVVGRSSGAVDVPRRRGVRRGHVRSMSVGSTAAATAVGGRPSSRARERRRP